MTNPVVERVARAMCLDMGICPDDWMTDPETWKAVHSWEREVSTARAAIAALREPTREMLNAAIDVDSFKLGNISPLGFRCSPQMLFEQCWAAMIDEVLKEE